MPTSPSLAPSPNDAATVPAVELDAVHKRFTVRTRLGRVRRERREVHAVDGISLRVERGAVVGYIGPNGAGKSTTIKMLTGILVPSSGTVRVGGLDPTRHRATVTRELGVVFGQRSQLLWDLPLADSFELLRHVYAVDRTEHRARLDRFADLLDLGDLLRTPVRQLSLGQRMRGELTAALLHAPSILLLDEPTIGLDVVSKEVVREFLVALNRDEGVTILLTTHDLADVERLCQRLVIIDGGRIIEDGTVAAVKARFGRERTLVVDLVDHRAPLVLADLAGVDAAHGIAVDGPRQRVAFDGEVASAAEVIAAITAEVGSDGIRDLAIEEPHIDDVVRRIYAMR